MGPISRLDECYGLHAGELFRVALEAEGDGRGGGTIDPVEKVGVGKVEEAIALVSGASVAIK